MTAYFNKGDKPLTITEYGRFAQWLRSEGMTPADLLQNNPEKIVDGYEDKKVTGERILSLLERGNAMAIAMQKWQNAGIWVITRADDEYPKRLKKRMGQKCPPILYGAGNKKILRTKGVAIIGSRDVSDADLDFTFKLGEKLALSGYSVVSGAARGVDEASMMGSIHADGTTIGVVADGLMQKTLSKKYRDAIMNNNLVLISPYYPEARFSVGNAMGRNKYIYALAESSIVVYSGLSGGTWEGAKENLKHQWVPLFVKEKIDERSGNSKLLEMGGLPLDKDILDREDMEFLFVVPKSKNVSEDTSVTGENRESIDLEEKILQVVKGRKLTISEIASEIDEEEKSVKKVVETLVKTKELQKHRNRPLKFSRIDKLPGMA
ncbi:putative DNA processing chain A [Hydrogenimonas sp.]|nr:putative DNA processing chain A [Hydrogenimonas sp.]